MQISEIVDAIIDLIKKNIIAKTNITQDVNAGDTVIKVVNSFHFKRNQEIVLIDNGYNTKGSSHYQKFEYAIIKEINDTRTITLKTPVLSDWLVSESSFVQKTIGHAPLYEDNVLYGDREVIPENEIAIAVEPVSLSNEWIYLQGGLSEESRMTILIYAKSVKTEEGMRILNKYSDAVYQLLNDNLHLNINDVQAPILDDINIGDSTFCIEDTDDNREYFISSGSTSVQYSFQDNLTPPCHVFCMGSRTISNGIICLTTTEPFTQAFKTSEFAVVSRMNRYLYDSRIDSVTFGVTQKGSAILRAAELSWFGKEVNEHSFPQHDKKVIYFEEEGDSSSSSD